MAIKIQDLENQHLKYSEQSNLELQLSTLSEEELQSVVELMQVLISWDLGINFHREPQRIA